GSSRATPDSGVPDADHRRLALIAEHGDRPRVEPEQTAVRRSQAEPACGEDTQGALERAVGASTDVVGRLASGGRLVPDGPAGHRRPDLRRRDALVAPVVPFD